MKETDFDRVTWWMRNIAPEGNLNFGDSKDEPIFNNKQFSELENLAKVLRITTPIRKRIFQVIMTSTDDEEAVQNLVQMNIPRKHHKDIAVVIIICCVQEKTYNGFYSKITRKLVKSLKGFAFGVLVTLFDNIKNLKEINLRKINNLAKFIADLFPYSSFGFKVFKAIEFDGISKGQELFLERSLSIILNKLKEEILHKHIQSLKENEEENFEFLEEFTGYITSKFLKKNPGLKPIVMKIAKSISN